MKILLVTFSCLLHVSLAVLVNRTITIGIQDIDSEAEIRVEKIILKETSGGKTEYHTIDMSQKKIFADEENHNENLLEVIEGNVTYQDVEGEKCGGNILEFCGTITTPGSYSPGIDCQWTIPVKSEKSLSITFDKFKVSIDSIQFSSPD